MWLLYTSASGNKYRLKRRRLTIFRNPSDKAESAFLGLIDSDLLLFKPSTISSSIMSEALSHSSHGSRGSLGPDDSISQVLPQYFTDDFRIDVDPENESSTHSDGLSSAPSGLLTPTFGSNSSEGIIQAGQSSATITGDISGMHLNVPHAFLPKRKARKRYSWLPSNGTEVFERGKWRWRCARYRFRLLYTRSFYTK